MKYSPAGDLLVKFWEQNFSEGAQHFLSPWTESAGTHLDSLFQKTS
jgi:hypothetical protein